MKPPAGLTREQQHLWAVLELCTTVDECKLSVSSYLYEQSRRSTTASRHTNGGSSKPLLRLVTTGTYAENETA